MSQSFYCGECVVNWAPFMTTDGACPVCGSGTVRKPREDPSPEAADLHKAALRARIAREKSEHNHKLFEDFVERRDALRAASQPTESIDTLEVAALLPVAAAFLRCADCGWVFPLETTDEHERCTQCNGPLLVAHEPEQHGEAA